ncbi:SF1B family DNA helicase RecD2 [Tenuibacillus multivorans]|uniref:ATP-dependent RecD2 DNA helicase n=1 Tax=Tenuibacillus multivorans TaxID=237069 RepID=A0A1G9ZHN2_9BACI|nr:ATP-dependent RecD-like DNA helicase [Tenuibacillus multivorans]GEL77495.1 ATP-dependent RecD-like DNA helicase [Tenuibacillus multivorans]SDN20880.1 exodeoxyribonuclease V alpha subunit [Tenuibacillus multivorans]
MTEKGFVKAKLNHMIFHKEEEQFSIASVSIIESNEELDEDELVVKGHFPPLTHGNEYTFYGTMKTHPKFGDQYQVFTYEKSLPKTEDSLVKYFASDLFYGIGQKTAQKIVDTLGIQAVDQILRDESVLERVPGLNAETKKRLIGDLRMHQGFDQVTVELAKYGVGLQLAQKLYEVFQERTIQQLNENPYAFVFEIEGFGFQRADEIAQEMGIEKDHPNRIEAGILHVLEQESTNGHVYVDEDWLLNKVSKLLYQRQHVISEDDLQNHLQSLEDDNLIVKEDRRVYLPHLYFSEEGIASQIKRLMDVEEDDTFEESELLKIIGEIEESEGFSYGEEQFEAIKKALNEKVLILTGGPGTGKTTVVKGIIHCYDALVRSSKMGKHDSDYILAAPTGRAAKRLSEATGLKAKTIHSLLGWSGEDEFEYNQGNQLEGELIIVDEFSMVDVWLANSLLKAIPSNMKIVFVGDEDQLPSVGPGQVLSDLLTAQRIPTSHLSEIYRQKEDSFIIKLAHHIKNNDIINMPLSKSSDFNFITSSQEITLPTVEQIVQHALNKGYKMKDIQVLAPMYKTEVGIHKLNRTLQEIFNPYHEQKRQIQHFDHILRTGDKVIQLVNQPDKNVYNGDIGEIIAIKKPNESESKKDELIIDFEGLQVSYTKQDFNQIMLAYAISIHKSQGSEFPIVILPVVRAFKRMLVKKLLYTAITRSKTSLIICGNYEAFIEGVQKENAYERNTTLVERLQSMFLVEQMTDEGEEEKELSPYDFM